MKVLHIISSLDTGGAQRLLTDILPLQQQDAEAELLVCRYVDNELSSVLVKHGVRIHSLDCRERNPFVTVKLIRWLSRYDVVHVHLFPMLYWAALASLFVRVCLVYTEHSTSNRRRQCRWLRPIERWVYSRYERIIAISEATRSFLCEWLDADDERVVTIENGIRLDDFAVCACKDFAERKRQIVMVSRFVPAKDQMTLIRAMQYVDDDLRLVLVGDGALLERCKSLVRDLDLQHRIDFLGSRDDISCILGQSLIGVQSSHWEGFGLTAVEMMAGGLPVVASNVQGLKQVVEGAGLLFECGDEQMLANHINSLYRNRQLYGSVRQRCEQRARRYDIKRMAQQYIGVYKQLSH